MRFILIAENEELPITFFPWWQLVIFVGVVILILFVLFPKNLLQKTLAYNQPSAATLSYLRAFKERYPQNKEIVFALIEQEIGMDQLQQAQANLASLEKIETMPAGQTLNQLRWIGYLMVRYKTYQSTINTPERIFYLRQLRTMAAALSDTSLNPRQLKMLAIDNLSLGRAVLSLKIYHHLMAIHALSTSDELAEGGSIAMQNNAHRDAAQFYWAAFYQTTAIKEKRKYALMAMKSLWAGGLTQEALSLAAELPESVVNDRQTLLFLSRLALAANHIDLAQKYVLKALLMKPNNKHE